MRLPKQYTNVALGWLMARFGRTDITHILRQVLSKGSAKLTGSVVKVAGVERLQRWAIKRPL
jgi:hypothetical protein